VALPGKRGTAISTAAARWQGRPAPTWTSLSASDRLTSTAAEPDTRRGTPACQEARPDQAGAAVP
jgi:hypothetical protein